ncbi:uncharacterized protein LOC129944237 [Eupeodes corollae]|uniref:uncharacterized protein LOC129944237 n=1 Tax=Eupeodes corollae TaxID=290404 RepID=UPI002490670B|nr:uncharacterized protein LOC129944237 [Eupeodes corollae]
MEKNKIFSKLIPVESITLDVKKAIDRIYSIPPAKYSSNLFRDLAVGFKSLVHAMEKEPDSQELFPLFLKWFKLYVRLQNQIDSNDPVRSKFESKIPVCTSYILASLQYQNRISNYHQLVMEMCLMLFKSAQAFTMRNIANLDIELISQLWMPVEFVGDYITQRLCLKLIVAVLEHLSVEERKKKVSDAKLEQEIEHLILKLSAKPNYFEEVSRELLNVFNMNFCKNCTVFSIYCTKALFGSCELYKPANVSNFWIDFNYTSKSVSLLCQLSERKQEEFYIKLKIDKLQIENQFDCIVYTIEQATFSTNVSAVLLSSRVAVFTLPGNQLDLLKANSDLIDYYNSVSYSESSDVATPNTKYLAELSEDSSLAPHSKQNSDIPKMKSARVKIYKFDGEPKNIDSTKTKNKLEKNPAAGISSLVSRVEYLPNYVGPSAEMSSNETKTTNDESIFRKPYAPVQFKTRKTIQAGKRDMQYKCEKPPVHTNTNMLRNENVNINQRHSEIINSSCSKKESSTTPINNLQQNNSTLMPLNKSHKEQLSSDRQNFTKLTRDKIPYSFTSIQISRNSLQGFSNATKRHVKQQAAKQHDFNKLQQKFMDETSLLEISATKNQNKKIIAHKSIDGNNFAFSKPKSSEMLENQKLASEPIDISQCVEIVEGQNPLPHDHCSSRDNNSNLVTICNPNSSFCPENDNHVTPSQAQLNESNIVSQNTYTSGKAIQSSNNDDLQKSTSLENTVSEITKSKNLRFFKYKHSCKIDRSTKTTRVKRNTQTKKNNMTEIHPKSKSVNLVKPLNYVPGTILSITEPFSESRQKGNSMQIGNLKHNAEDRADFLKQSNVPEDDSKITVITAPASANESTLKLNKRRTSNRKTPIKQVQTSNFVPYSIWKIGQNEKTASESVILAQHPTLQTKTDWPTMNYLDLFDIVKHGGNKTQSNSTTQKDFIARRRCDSSSSDSILTFQSPEQENKIKSAQPRSPPNNKPRSSLDSDTIRDTKSVDMIHSPVPIPSELARSRSKSISIERIFIPNQISIDLNSPEVLNSFQHPIESNLLLENRTTSFTSPIYEDLDDEVPEVPFQSPKPLVDEYNEEVPQLTSDSEDRHQHLSVSPNIQFSAQSQQIEIYQNENVELEFVEHHLKHKSAKEHASSSSRGSSISVCSDGEQDNLSNQINTQKHEVVVSFRKRTHSTEGEESSEAKIASRTQYSTLKGYDQLFPEFVKKLTAEKNRVLENIKTKLNEEMFNSFTKRVEEVMKGIESHQTAIKEEQDKLISILKKIEWHHQVLQKNQSELERVHDQIIEHQKLWDNTSHMIIELYKEAEDNLLSYADGLKRDQWHSFSTVIVDSLNARLSELLSI